MAEQDDPFAAYAVKASDDPFAAFAVQAAPKNPPLLTTLNRNPNVEVPDPSASWVGRLRTATEGMRYPTGVGDLLPYLIPSGVEGAINAGKNLTRQMSGALEGSSIVQAPRRLLGRVVERWQDPLTVGERQFRDAPLYKQMEQIPTEASGPMRGGSLRTQTPPVAEPVPSHAPIAPAESAPAMSATERAALAKQGYSPELIDKIEAQMRPVASHPPSPLRQPRVVQGAEKVGRAEGLSKEAVRQQTGPIVGEEPGTASPIIPEDPWKRIIDTMRSLPKEGGAREAYVQQATAGKNRGQIEQLRRTLEHLGLLVPVAAGATALRRDSLLNGMRE